MIDNGVAGNEYDLSKATAKPGDPSFRAAEAVSVVEEDCASMAAGDEAEHFWSSPEGSTVVEATVVSGLESMAREEIKEKLSLYGQTSRGRVWFTVPNDRLEEVSSRIVQCIQADGTCEYHGYLYMQTHSTVAMRRLNRMF